MRLFSDIPGEKINKMFYKEPGYFNKRSDRELLSYALGATLYMPATRPNIHQDLLSKKHAGLSSMVICLEDAIGDDEVELAENLLCSELENLSSDLMKGLCEEEDLPLIFVRIRSYEQLMRLKSRIPNGMHLLTGFVLPKFSPAEGCKILTEIKELNSHGYCLYAMPILETKEIIQKETRLEELIGIKKVLDQYFELILNVRIGATDFSGLYGIRRNSDTTVYDIAVIRDCISDIINIFLRADQPYVISGPVWEYFSSKERLLKPQIRQTPFMERLGQDGLKMRTDLIDRHMDGLIREIAMDISNGLTGKTIIHPTHIRPVQALNTVTLEEYLDAQSIAGQAGGKIGVMKSNYQNKMNEIKPHLYWAKKILLKSEVYGVLQDEITYIDLLKNETFNSDTQLINR
ncbi:HpcH/HpaI aldolase/citrate lyase family protein [Cytobacillus firmus]|uniref:HpcH/HpaI aldolase/citrate lyase family protein n=1 Tax=Cytobacillus firmus TaxID=1399 RepID=UPI0018CF0095|nr:HpcH/HpaI aldolase/citrate lyase family protein [Cytobacillus firmus]MBG9546610.1 citrate lyase subunit beta [Cytobacillus firmus]MBG9602820.1 citrate lyase subunit beta [Cytobacillus firmus]MBG9657027.1 citrate lyase subunit beta [Cytobacillus firmus]MDD9311302.1 HpcH/HpaI aldolase/citrate lyase family protein [Cytobacillus firmus]MED1906699.1 HpcH/HpaI aldolase/citrate lyase family protein [Cytobacillus firmus]